MQDSGFYKMKRKWMDDPIFYNEPYTRAQAFLWLIEAASYKDRTTFVGGHSIPLKRGELLAAERTLSEKWQWGRQKVRTYLTHLENDGKITRSITQGMTLIKVCNYRKFQDKKKDDNPEENQETTQEQPSSNPAVTQEQPIIEEGKEGKERKKKDTSYPKKIGTRMSRDFELPEEWRQWAEDNGCNDVQTEAANFKDWFLGCAGAKGVKLDWFATWRVWIRKNHSRPVKKTTEQMIAGL